MDRSANDAPIPVITLCPERIADQCDWLMTFLLLLREDAAENGIDANGRKHPRRHTRRIHLNRTHAAGKFVVCPDVTAHGGERSGSDQDSRVFVVLHRERRIDQARAPRNTLRRQDGDVPSCGNVETLHGNLLDFELHHFRCRPFLVLSASRGPNLGQMRSILSHPAELTECEISNLQMAGGELAIMKRFNHLGDATECRSN